MDIVLIGGQAVNLWAMLYLSRIEALEAEELFTSQDADFLGDKAAVSECASRLNLGRAILNPPFSQESPVNSGIVKYVDDEGNERTIDFLATILGLDERKVRDTAQTLRIGDQPIQILHPVLCIFGRVPLILRLGRTDDHTISQLRASVLCAKEFLVDLVGQGDLRKVYRWNEEVFRYAMTPDAVEIYEKYNIDVFKTVLFDDRLSEEFRERRYPQMREKLQAKQTRSMNRRRTVAIDQA